MEERKLFYSTKNEALIYLIDDDIKLYINCKINEANTIKAYIEDYTINTTLYSNAFSEKNKRLYYYKDNKCIFSMNCPSKKSAGYKYYMVIDCSNWLNGRV